MRAIDYRSALLSACIAASVGGCGDGPAEPQSLAPVLSNFSYTVEELNLEECPPSGLQNSTLFRWTIDYDDVNGDVVAPLRMLWGTSFTPSGIAKAAYLVLPAEAIVDGDGYSGTIAQTQCVRFVEESSIDITVSILDEEGNQSESSTLHIVRPEGALVPPPSSVADPAAGTPFDGAAPAP